MGSCTFGINTAVLQILKKKIYQILFDKFGQCFSEKGEPLISEATDEIIEIVGRGIEVAAADTIDPEFFEGTMMLGSK